MQKVPNVKELSGFRSSVRHSDRLTDRPSDSSFDRPSARPTVCPIVQTIVKRWTAMRRYEDKSDHINEVKSKVFHVGLFT